MLGSYTCGQCPSLLKCDILRTDVAKYVHIFCGSNSDIYLAGNIAPTFTFLCLVGRLSCFLWCCKSFSCCFLRLENLPTFLHANHTSFSNLSFKVLLIHFLLISLLSFSLQLQSELPLTVSFKCVHLFIVICVRLSRLVPPPFCSEKLNLYSY